MKIKEFIAELNHFPDDCAIHFSDYDEETTHFEADFKYSPQDKTVKVLIHGG